MTVVTSLLPTNSKGEATMEIILPVYFIAGLLTAAWRYTRPAGTLPDKRTMAEEYLVYGTISAGIFWWIYWPWKLAVIIILIFTSRILP